MKELNEQVDLPIGGKNKVWESILFDTPEYKELRNLIELVNYNKGKVAKKASIVSPTETQFVPDWLKK
jgi:hypothetical protein